MARVCASSSLIPGVNGLGLTPILLSASDELKRQVFPSIASGEAMISYALSEREAGSDAAVDEDPRAPRRRRLGAQRHQVLDHQRRRLHLVHGHGRDRPGEEGQRHLRVRRAQATTPASRSGPRSASSASTARRPGRSTSRTARIPADRIIGAEGTGFKTALQTLDHTRPTIGAQAVGIAQGALDVAISYVKERKQFGKHLAEFQGLQFMIADMAMKVEAARQLVYVAASRAERGEANLGFISSAAKCLASDTAMSVTTDAVQLLGGAGYTKDFPVERMMRDAKITQIYEGTNQVQRLVMARSLLR